MKLNIRKEDAVVIAEIAKRAHAMNEDYKVMDAVMDLTAAHLNGCSLKLSALLDAPEFDFAHDVFGIANTIDRNTGELKDCFCPRYAA